MDQTPPNDRQQNARAAGAAVAARWRQVITGNAQRMARRLAAGQAVSAEVLADALAIDIEAAAAWLASPQHLTEDACAVALLELAMKEPTP